MLHCAKSGDISVANEFCMQCFCFRYLRIVAQVCVSYKHIAVLDALECSDELASVSESHHEGALCYKQEGRGFDSR
jgi:hypothetical protein